MAVAGTTSRCAGFVGLVGVALLLPPAAPAAEAKAAVETASFRALIEAGLQPSGFPAIVIRTRLRAGGTTVT
jgi:hypothetical protein